MIPINSINLLTIAVVAILAILPKTCAKDITMNEAVFYLSHYGYLPPINKYYSIDEATFVDGLMDFQRFYRLNVTGKLDSETTKLMSSPRCGNPDKIYGTYIRSKRGLQGSQWSDTNITYRISKYSKQFDRVEVDKIIARAFNVWSKYTNLTFTAKRSYPVHIDIRFDEDDHGDFNLIDGPGHVWARDYIHFNDSEQWTIGSSVGTDLFQVAAHKFGHALGLTHSDVSTALMAPHYHEFDLEYPLHPDDIRAIQLLYGVKTSDGDEERGSKPKNTSTTK